MSVKKIVDGFFDWKSWERRFRGEVFFVPENNIFIYEHLLLIINFIYIFNFQTKKSCKIGINKKKKTI